MTEESKIEKSDSESRGVGPPGFRICPAISASSRSHWYW